MQSCEEWWLWGWKYNFSSRYVDKSWSRVDKRTAARVVVVLRIEEGRKFWSGALMVGWNDCDVSTYMHILFRNHHHQHPHEILIFVFCGCTRKSIFTYGDGRVDGGQNHLSSVTRRCLQRHCRPRFYYAGLCSSPQSYTLRTFGVVTYDSECY